MNIKLTQQKNDTLLTIEADFDKFIAENFGGICQAMAKRFRILMELESVQRKQGIETEKLIEVIRRCGSHQAALDLLPREFGISAETSNFILNAEINELNQILDPDYLQSMVKQYRAQVRSLIKLNLEYAMNKRKLSSDITANQPYTQFIIHRGSHQIGGNCVELATRNARILIDCGLPLDYDEQDVETQNEIRENARKWLQNCDAVFLSHYHADHYGLLNEAPQGTKVYATKETAELMKISGMFGEDLTEYLDIHPIEDTVTIKDFRVTKFDVDHSAFGACAFLFEVCGKRILYSGDIRLHGKKGVLYKNLPQNVDYLFLEGTNLGRGVRQKTETAIENEFVKQFSSNPDSLHLVWCSSQNIDRIVALYRACVRTNRVLGVDPYAAYALELAHQNRQSIPNKTFPSLEIYFPWSFTNWMIEKDRQLVLDLRRGAIKLDQTDLPVNPSKYVLLYRPKLIGDLNRYISKTKVCLTNSIWAQYWEQDKSEINRLKAWIEDKPELRQKLPDIHTSGHADVASLQKIVEHVQPKCIVPIHTEMPEKYKKLFQSYTVLAVTDETTIDLTNTKE